MGANLSTFPHSTLHGNANDAIIAIETELGVAPSDTFSTVKARLDDIAAKVASVTPVLAALTSWTPSVTQAVNVTVTNNYSRYQRVGRMVTGWFKVTVTGAGTTANPIIVTFPVTAATTQLVVGSGEVFDTSASNKFSALLFMPSTTTFDFRYTNSTLLDNRLGIVTGSGSFGLAAGDTLMGSFHYEAAAD